MRARGARSAVLVGAAVVALATGGLAYGSSADDGGTSTLTAKVGKAAPPGTSPGGTASMKPKQGVQPSATVPKGSTADARSTTSRSPVPRVTATDVDNSDKGVKGARATKDRGSKNAPVTKG
jgi:hypothetical protein